MGFVQEVLRIPSATKKVDSRLLNLAGTQVARTLAARAIQRGRSLARSATPGTDELRRDGILVIPDFLPDAEFFSLVRECEHALADQTIPRVHHEHGKNRLEQIDAIPLAGGRPHLWRFLENPRLNDLVSSIEGRRIDPLAGHRVIERLQNGAGAEPDPESTLHVDTFFHTHKAWLYLTDVEPKHGPLCYVPGSHHLTLRHLWQGYRSSVAAGTGSRRIAYDEIRANAKEEVVYTCSKNTLVIANTAGYHRRLPGQTGQVRLAIQLSYRFNPFFPAWIDMARHERRVRALLGRVRA